MKPDLATALLALYEANKALMQACFAIRRLGLTEEATYCSDLGADTVSFMDEIRKAGQPIDAECVVLS